MNGTTLPVRRDAPGIALTILTLALAVVVYTWTPSGHPSPGGFSDSIDYLMFADFFRDWFGGNPSEISREFFAHTRFPPLFPLLIMAFGGRVGEAQPAYWLTAASAIASIALAIAWFTRESRDLRIGALLALPFALSPAYFLLTLNAVSEPLFIVMMLGAFLLARRARASRTSLLAFALVVGATPLCRMAGVALIIAATVELIRMRERAPWERLVGIALLAVPTVLWLAYRSTLPIVESYDDQFTLQRILTVFGGWKGFLVDQPLRIVSAFGTLLYVTDGVFKAVVAGLFTLLAIHGWWLRARRWTMDAVFLVPYLGLVFVWPYPAEITRLTMVAMPVLLLCAWESVCAIREAIAARAPASGAAAMPPPRWPTTIAFALVAVALTLPFAVRAVSRIAAPMDADLDPYKRGVSFFTMDAPERAFGSVELTAKVMNAMAVLHEYVPKDECVASFQPQAAWYQSGGRVRPRLTPWPADPAKPFFERIGGCRYVFVMATTSPQLKQPPLYPMRELLGHGKLLFMSQVKSDGRDIPAAALIEVTDRTGGEGGAPAPADEPTTGEATDATPAAAPASPPTQSPESAPTT